jgi:lysophospholipase L1-like esterase
LHLFPQLLPKVIRQHSSPRVVFHPYIGHLHTPNYTGVLTGSDFQATFHTDGHGFRGPWPWPEQVEILTLGDSLTFGYGVEDEEAWPALLAQAFPRLRVLNLGLIGASPEQYVRIYETFGPLLRPKLVVVGFFADNDFSDTIFFHQWVQAGSHGNYLDWRDFDRHGPVKGFLQRHSSLVHLLLLARDVYNHRRVSEPRLLTLGSNTQLQLQPSAFLARTRGATPDQPAFQQVVQALTRLQALTTAQGTQLLIVFQPSKERVYMPFLGESLPDPSAPLRAVLEAQGIPTLEVFPAFQLHATTGAQLFFTADSHPNRQGYRLIAQEVLTYLTHHAAVYGFPELMEAPAPH